MNKENYTKFKKKKKQLAMPYIADKEFRGIQ